jgi:hypothetical protein
MLFALRHERFVAEKPWWFLAWCIELLCHFWLPQLLNDCGDE